MANILRGIVVLLAVAAVLNAASFEEKLPSVEDAPNNLGKAASAELVDDSATDQKDFVEDSAAGVEGRPMWGIYVKHLKTFKAPFCLLFLSSQFGYVISSFFKLQGLIGAYFSVISSLLDGQARSKHTPLEFFPLEFFSTLVRTSNFLAGIIFLPRANLELPRGDFFHSRALLEFPRG